MIEIVSEWGPYHKLLENTSSNEEHDELPIRYDTFPGDYMSEKSNDSKPNDLIEFYISNETNEYEKVCVSREEVKHAEFIIDQKRHVAMDTKECFKDIHDYLKKQKDIDKSCKNMNKCCKRPGAS